ncbi:gliding motility protein RemB [Mucilaginibacter celer]|uniref:gliding motility protein RemB n=1 Tax=Mucilaginibacter celer TaxID=2305508 RepID=UPI001FE143C0|nr:gliding motility protein RemB [Mucilaginibacter celer]
MQNIYSLNLRKALIAAACILFTAQLSKAQSVYLPNSYQLYQKFNADIYSVKSSSHTSLRPFLIDSTILHTYDSVMNVGIRERKTWGGRKLFNEHLFDVKDKGYTFYADYITDLQVGRDFNNSKSTNLNTRGFQLGGTVGDKFSFYSSGFENSAKFVSYYNDYVNDHRFIPGQAYARHYNGQPQNSQDWSYVTAILSYSPTQKLNITLGEDKMFIGDGYRSVLLSDFASNMPLLRLTADLGPVRYMIAWAYIQDLRQPPYDTFFGSNPRKWALFHYIDWNISKRVSFGMFNALITPETDDQAKKRGFDANFVNPVLFTSSLGPGGGKDNVFLGFNAKYKILDKTALYGQIMFDRFKGSNFFSGNNADNTNGWQLGIRGADIFKVKRLNYLFEYNTVKPYTYTDTKLIGSYTFYGDALAHPLGANFREVLGILNYSVGRFDFQGQINYAKYGLDATKNDNFGMDITKPFVPSANNTTTVGQGLSTQLYYGEGTVAYILNPKYNLRFELGALYRQEKNAQKDTKNTLITFGLRSSFRNLYHDF